MTKTVVNLTESIAQEELNKRLDQYPSNHPYRAIFSLPKPREELISFILWRVPHQYTCCEAGESGIVSADAMVATQRRSQIVQLLEEGMSRICQRRDRGCDVTAASERNAVVCSPSHWFG